MTIKNNKLNGTDFIAGELLTAANLNDTNNAIIDEHRTLAVPSAQQSFEILKASGSIDNEDFIFADRFTSAAGVKSTVDTTNTTSLFIYNKYELKMTGTGDGADDSNVHGLTLSSTSSNVAKTGIQIYCKVNSILKSVTKYASDASTKAYLYKGQDYATAGLMDTGSTFSSNISTFSGNVLLIAGNYYWIVCDKVGASRAYYFNNATFPYSNTNFNITKGRDTTAESTVQAFSVVSFITQNVSGNTTSSTLIVQPTTLTGSELVLSNFAKVVLVSSNAGDGANDTRTNSGTGDTGFSSTEKHGVNILYPTGIVLKSVNKKSTCTATKCYLIRGGTTGQTLESVTFSTNTATFTKNIVLKSGDIIAVDNSGSSYSIRYFSSPPTYPLSMTDYSITINDFGGSNGNAVIDTITTQNATGALTSISNITVDITDGTTTLSAQNINDTINISSLGGGQLKLTYNLSTTDSTITPEVYGIGGILK